MFIVHSYATAVILCVVTMLCWGSWANTQKLAGKKWRFELFYWDYVIGILLFSLVSALTLGSIGTQGRSFADDLAQAGNRSLASAFVGGIVFNAANILFSAAIAIAGMAVAFPVAIGLALVLGVVLNYAADEKGSPVLLFSGVAFVTVAIVLNAIAYKRSGNGRAVSYKGIFISLSAGLLMSFFYRFIANAMDLHDFVHPAPGKMTPYTAVFIFSTGIFFSNFLFNTLLMRRPFEGPAVHYREYFAGKPATHAVGILGGLIWGLGNSLNLIAAGKAGPAISYGLGQGATLIAALWGVFVWKEFSKAPRGVNTLIGLMLFFFVVGLACVVYAGL